MSEVKLLIPFLPPSVNDMYVGGRAAVTKDGKPYRRLVQNPKVKSFKDRVWVEWVRQGKSFRPYPKEIYRLTLLFGSHEWMTQKNDPAVWDVTNLIKIAEDAFADAAKYPDHLNFEVRAMKIVTATEFTLFSLEKVEIRNYGLERFKVYYDLDPDRQY